MLSELCPDHTVWEGEAKPQQTGRKMDFRTEFLRTYSQANQESSPHVRIITSHLKLSSSVDIALGKIGRLMSEEHGIWFSIIPSGFWKFLVTLVIIVWLIKCLSERETFWERDLWASLRWIFDVTGTRPSCVKWKLGAVFSRKESQLGKTPERVNEATGITCHFVGTFHPGMNHSSLRRASAHPKGKRLHHGSFVAIYTQL